MCGALAASVDLRVTFILAIVPSVVYVRLSSRTQGLPLRRIASSDVVMGILLCFRDCLWTYAAVVGFGRELFKL